MDDFLTTEEASNLLDCHQNWIRELCRDGKIECKRFGRSWMVSRTSLEAYKNKPHEKPGPKPKKEPGDKPGSEV